MLSLYGYVRSVSSSVTPVSVLALQKKHHYCYYCYVFGIVLVDGKMFMECLFLQEERSRGEHNLTNISKTHERMQQESRSKPVLNMKRILLINMNSLSHFLFVSISLSLSVRLVCLSHIFFFLDLPALWILYSRILV